MGSRMHDLRSFSGTVSSFNPGIVGDGLESQILDPNGPLQRDPLMKS